MALTIITLIKQVPVPSEMRMGEDGLMDRTKAKSIINIDCQFGLEAGLQLRKQNPDARLIVCSMGPGSFETSLRTAVSMGYDEAYLLSDRKLGGSDTYATGLAFPQCLNTWDLPGIQKILILFWQDVKPATEIQHTFHRRLQRISEFLRLHLSRV